MFEFPLAGSRLKSLAEKYGTPLWVYHQQTIADRIDELKKFDVIRYAQKANSNLALLSYMRSQEVVVDSVSSGEIQRALRSGYQGGNTHPDIVYTADIFDAEALSLIKQHQLAVNVGSPDMIPQLAAAGIHTNVILRVNPGFGHGHSQKVNTGGELSKHGIWHEQISDCLELGKVHGQNIIGLHMHIGSGSDFEHLAKVCDAMVQAGKVFGSNLQVISTGGGLPIPYNKSNLNRIDLQAFFQLWDKARKELEAFVGHPLTLEVEPGRYLIAESGYLVSRVASVKTMGSKNFYLVDAGFTDLVRPAFYGAYHHISIINQTPTTSELDVVVAGPLCESCDVFTQTEGGVVVPRRLAQAQVGDFLVLHDAGAYGMAMSSNYNTRPFAAEVLVAPQGEFLIRERQSWDHLFAPEAIPAHLK
jgi:diaminopimelate decarboxylase